MRYDSSLAYRMVLVCSCIVAAAAVAAPSTNGVGKASQPYTESHHAAARHSKPGKGRSFPPPSAAWPVASVILGAPTDRQITVTVATVSNYEGCLSYGPDRQSAANRTEVLRFEAGSPLTLTLTNLLPDTAYHYRFRYKTSGEVAFRDGPEYAFHTQRPPGATFTFEVQGDSHPERTPKQNDPALYQQTLLAVAKDRPDFYLCMGDDFSVDTLDTVTAASVESVYRKQLPYLGLVAHSSPLFLVNGNHEQAARCNLDGTPDNVAVWAQVNRNRFFPQPAPDGFYSGDREQVEHIGLLRDYYAWTWGDALFVVIDPYWHSATAVDNVFGGGKKRHDMWGITLGVEQYQWLKTTLETSRARFKFVFAHHVNGTGRGGVESADQYEWGGAGATGGEEFAAHRPGWPLPLHALMASNGVSIFFQGHDHLFARQEKDGVIYQTVPEPADPNYTLFNREAYRSGVCLPNSGRVRVTVSPDTAKVEYVRSYRAGEATPEHPDGEVAYSYAIPPRGSARIPPSAGMAPLPVNVVQGRPTDHSVTLSLMSSEPRETVVEYGAEGQPLGKRSAAVKLASGEPCTVVLDGLAADTAYAFRLLDAVPGGEWSAEAATGRCHTCRSAGAPFVFTVQADSHLDSGCSTNVYSQCLGLIRGERPDFHIDLGDTFMTGKLAGRQEASAHYLAQRGFFGLIGWSVPLFLVIGNHDGEETFRRGAAEADGLAVWSCLQRKRYFPNPEPDPFYTGNETRQPYAGRLDDYYAWTWGDALFVVLDPYWTSGSTHGGEDPWAMSLGREQYEWLARTLRAARARYKFVFIHQLVGGLDRGGRGGAEAVPLYEWGGHEKDGRETFAVHRPGWALPIHSLLVETGVSAVFHGHDHFFAHQERDGVVYQLVPQPSHPEDVAHQAAEYGYKSGELLPGAGYLRVTVSSAEAVVDYIRLGKECAVPTNRVSSVACRYSIISKAP